MSTTPVNPVSGDVATPSAPRRRGADVSGEGFDRALEEVLVGRAAHGRDPGTAASRGVAFGLSQRVPEGHPAAGAPGRTSSMSEAGSGAGDASASSSSSSSSPVVDAALQALVAQAQAVHALHASSDLAKESVTLGWPAPEAVTDVMFEPPSPIVEGGSAQAAAFGAEQDSVMAMGGPTAQASDADASADLGLVAQGAAVGSAVFSGAQSEGAAAQGATAGSTGSQSAGPPASSAAMPGTPVLPATTPPAGVATGASMPVADPDAAALPAAAASGATPATQLQFSAAAEVAPVDTPGGAVVTAPAPGGASTQSPVTPVAPQPPPATPGAGPAAPPAADDPAVSGVPTAPLPGTWGDAVAPAPGPGVGGVTPDNPTAPVADDGAGPAPDDSAPPVATAPVATPTPTNGDPGSAEQETDTPDQPIPLPTPDAAGDPDSEAADGTLPNVITPPRRGTLNPDVPTSVVQPIAADLEGPAPSGGLLSPQIQDLLEVGGQGSQSPARTLLVPPPAPAVAPAPPMAAPPPAPAAMPASAAMRAPAEVPAPVASAPPAAPVAGPLSRSTSTAAQAPEPAPTVSAQAQAAAERVVPAFTLPSQPVATPVAPTPSAILTGTPGAPPHQQVATAVGPLLRGPDGSYQVQLNLLPAHLGQVRISVEVRGSEVAIQMLTIDNNARDLLRGNLDSLRQDLQQMGLRSGHLDVSDGRDGSQRRWNEPGFGDLPGGGRGSGGRGQHGPADTLDNDPVDDSLTSNTTTRPAREGDTLDVRV